MTGHQLIHFPVPEDSMKRICIAATVLVALLGLGAPALSARGLPSSPSRTVVVADTSWGGCGTCHNLGL